MSDAYTEACNPPPDHVIVHYFDANKVAWCQEVVSASLDRKVAFECGIYMNYTQEQARREALLYAAQLGII